MSGEGAKRSSPRPSRARRAGIVLLFCGVLAPGLAASAGNSPKIQEDPEARAKRMEAVNAEREAQAKKSQAAREVQAQEAEARRAAKAERQRQREQTAVPGEGKAAVPPPRNAESPAAPSAKPTPAQRQAEIAAKAAQRKAAQEAREARHRAYLERRDREQQEREQRWAKQPPKPLNKERAGIPSS